MHVLSTPPAFILSQDQTLRGICSRAEARDSRSVIRTDIRSDPPTSVRKPMQFGSVLCLPVWSFDGPSRQDGVSVVRFANLYWLVTVSSFQGSGCSGFPAYPAVLPAACRRTRIGGKEIHYATASNVSTVMSNFLGPSFWVSRKSGLGQQKRLPNPSEGVETAWLRLCGPCR